MSATITKADKVQGEDAFWQGPSGPMQKWAVTIDNDGEEVRTQVLRRPDSPDPTGLEAEKNDEGRWKVASQGGGGRGGGGRGGGGQANDYKADRVKLASENYRGALRSAVERANVLGPEITAKDILAVADAFFERIQKAAAEAEE